MTLLNAAKAHTFLRSLNTHIYKNDLIPSASIWFHANGSRAIPAALWTPTRQLRLNYAIRHLGTKKEEKRAFPRSWMRDNFSPLGRIFRADPDDEWGHPPSFSSSTNELAHSEREREKLVLEISRCTARTRANLDNFFTPSFECIGRVSIIVATVETND